MPDNPSGALDYSRESSVYLLRCLGKGRCDGPFLPTERPSWKRPRIKGSLQLFQLTSVPEPNNRSCPLFSALPFVHSQPWRRANQSPVRPQARYIKHPVILGTRAHPHQRPTFNSRNMRHQTHRHWGSRRRRRQQTGTKGGFPMNCASCFHWSHGRTSAAAFFSKMCRSGGPSFRTRPCFSLIIRHC